MTKPFVRIFDVLFSVLFFPPFVFLLLKALVFRYRIHDDVKDFLCVSSGASIQEIEKKYGSLEPLFQYDGPPTEGVFRNRFHFWYPTMQDQDVSFPGNWRVFEQKKGFGVFPVLGLLFTLCRIFSLLEAYPVALIRCSDPYISGPIGLVLRLVFQIPFCVSIHTDYEKCEILQPHSLPRTFGSLRLSRMIEKLILRRASIVLPISGYLKRVLEQKGAPFRRMEIFPHGVDLSRFLTPSAFDPYEHFQIPATMSIISSVGRIDLDHYVDDLLEVAVRIVQQHSDVVFVLAGDGVERGRLEAHVRELGLGQRILFPGMIDNKQVAGLRQNSALAICFFDGFSLIEACASGCPVIAYDVEWNFELVKNVETGFLVKEKEVKTVEEKIDFLLRNPSLRKTMGEKGRTLACLQHSLESTSHRKKQIYQRTLCRQARAA
jgi:glycosyltransferase involved in cell wall biosynthesis